MPRGVKVQVLLPAPRRSKVRFAPTYFFNKNKSSARFLAPPFSQKGTLRYHLFAISCLLPCLSSQTETRCRWAFGLLLLLAATFLQKSPFALNAAAPYSQKSPLGSPVRLQARSQRQAVATTFLRYCALRALKNP